MKKSYNKRQKVNDDKECGKHVKWGPVVVHNIPSSTSSKTNLRKELKSLGLTKIDQIIQQDKETSERFLSKNGLMIILEIANESSQTMERYDSSAFRDIIFKYSQVHDDLSEIFTGFRIHLIAKKHTNITPQVFEDYDTALTDSSAEEIPDNSSSSNTISDKNIGTDKGAAVEGGHKRLIFHNDNLSQESEYLSKEINTNQKDDIDIIIKRIQITESKAVEMKPFLLYLEQLYAWIYELPEWMQEQILNSTPIKTIIEETETLAAIYDSSKYVLNHLNNMFTTEKVTNCDYDVVVEQEDKVTFLDSAYRDLVNTTMILEDTQVTGLILPMVDINSGNILGENEFGTLAILMD
ncbi:MAG: hypothetical protein N4A31_03540 [Rickettsiales bacterium]|jgi:hypothetical protein|nr:hypothetical protein [Rickettsiales bacterium]